MAAVALLGAGSLAACSYSPPGPPVEQAVAIGVDAPRVTLLNPGTGAKRVLNYQDIGTEHSATVEVSEGFAQDIVAQEKVAGFTASPETFNTTLPLEFSVDEASEPAEGQAPATRNVFLTVGEPGFSGPEDLSSAAGFQFGWRAADSGQVSSVRLAAPQAAGDKARALTEQAIMAVLAAPVVFPAEEVGAGAQWTVESRVAGQSTMLRTTTYTITSLDDSGVDLAVRIEERPSLGALSLEGLGPVGVGPDASGAEGSGSAGSAQSADAPSGTLNVLESTTRSTGSLRVSFTSPLPTGQVETTTRVVYGQEDTQARVLQTTQLALDFADAS
ncbi:hypothetical protein G7Y31_07930 [Corynebacterium lizhenjunii]|uniref:Uncharacterized protein n=1 Tax=Corynebacterium lizhenjunii TaxID=2709394 RepID=A0A7T0KGJ6_9CORY|nr:hypothetical protein G7Y31_07930 [Corynebacterium lizhenjunii]